MTGPRGPTAGRNLIHRDPHDASKEPYAARMRDALRQLLAVTWDYLEDCATKQELREAAVRARRRLEA